MKIQFVMLQTQKARRDLQQQRIKYRSETDDKSRNLLTSQIAHRFVTWGPFHTEYCV